MYINTNDELVRKISTKYDYPSSFGDFSKGLLYVVTLEHKCFDLLKAHSGSEKDQSMFSWTTNNYRGSSLLILRGSKSTDVPPHNR